MPIEITDNLEDIITTREDHQEMMPLLIWLSASGELDVAAPSTQQYSSVGTGLHIVARNSAINDDRNYFGNE